MREPFHPAFDGGVGVCRGAEAPVIEMRHAQIVNTGSEVELCDATGRTGPGSPHSAGKAGPSRRPRPHGPSGAGPAGLQARAIRRWADAGTAATTAAR